MSAIKRWGIIGSGYVCSDFVNALKSVEGAVIHAVGSSSLAKSNNFGDSHNIPNRYGSYAELVADSEVDVVYIGTVHTFHKEHAMMALNAGKHVLVEKPIAINRKDAGEVVDLARSKNLFLMEGMWTRFFPAIRKARELMTGGAIGDVVSVTADFGVAFEPDNTRAFNPALGGGGLLDIGIYPVATVPLAFGTEAPSAVAAAGALTDSGVDAHVGLSLAFGQRGFATVSCTTKAVTPEETIYTGLNGRIRVHGPAHCPTRLTITTLKSRTESVEEVLDFPLCEPAATSTGFNFPNSEGFAYEAAAVQQCLLDGLLESPEYTLEESLWVMDVLDETRRQIGLKYPMEVQQEEERRVSASTTQQVQQ